MTGARRPDRRAVLRAGAAAGIAVSLQACARIPVRSGTGATPVGEDSGGSAPYVRPRPPVQGASPAEIVAGFVRAGVGADDDYAVARSYLTPAARSAWDPRAGVTICSSDQEITAAAPSEGIVSLSLQAVGQVDHLGVRTVLASTSEREIDVPLTQVDGQWRISDPPAGIFLSAQVFEILFTPGRLYFVDPRGQHLVPDVRWVVAQEQATALLRRLGGGPVPFLRDAVTSAVPSDLAGREASVRTDDTGAARVELPASVQALPLDRRRIAVAQITATLQSLRLMGDVQLTARGRTVTPDASPARPVSGHRALGAAATGVVALAETRGGAAPAQVIPSLAAQAVLDPAIGADGALAAALSADARSVLVTGTAADAPVRTVDGGGPLVAPRPDDAGYVWTARRDGDGGLRALRADGTDVELDAPWLADRRVVGLDVSGDATRLLVATMAMGSSRLAVCGILRDAAGVPRSVSEPVAVVASLDRIDEATWYDETSVVVLGRVGDDAHAIVVDLSGMIEQLPAPPEGTTRLAGTAVSGVLYASSDDLSLSRSDGTVWTPLAVAARGPSFF